MKYILIILVLLIPNCSQPKMQQWQQMVLYADYTNKKLYLLNIQTLEEYSILDNISEQDIFFFWGKDKVIRVPPQGTDAPYFEYDINTKKWMGYKYKKTYDDLDITTGACKYKDSLLILSGIKNIYYETPHNNMSDVIDLDLGFIFGIKCSSKGILAVLYSDEERPNFSKHQNLLLYDLMKKKIIYPEYKTVFLKEWSYSGDFLSFVDSTQVKLKYPSLKLEKDYNFPIVYKYLNDSLYVFEDEITSKNGISETQLLLHNLNDNSNLTLTNKPTRKELFDVYSK